MIKQHWNSPIRLKAIKTYAKHRVVRYIKAQWFLAVIIFDKAELKESNWVAWLRYV